MMGQSGQSWSAFATATSDRAKTTATAMHFMVWLSRFQKTFASLPYPAQQLRLVGMHIASTFTSVRFFDR
jgi:hypothetical protein